MSTGIWLGRSGHGVEHIVNVLDGVGKCTSVKRELSNKGRDLTMVRMFQGILLQTDRETDKYRGPQAGQESFVCTGSCSNDN